MTTVQQAIGATVRVLAFLVVFLALPMLPAGAQTGLLDLNTAPESELQKLPHMTPAVVKGLMEKRPFPSILELNQFLLDQKSPTGSQTLLTAKHLELHARLDPGSTPAAQTARYPD